MSKTVIEIISGQCTIEEMRAGLRTLSNELHHLFKPVGDEIRAERNDMFERYKISTGIFEKLVEREPTKAAELIESVTEKLCEHDKALVDRTSTLVEKLVSESLTALITLERDRWNGRDNTVNRLKAENARLKTLNAIMAETNDDEERSRIVQKIAEPISVDE